jgi:hypothetical protein
MYLHSMHRLFVTVCLGALIVDQILPLHAQDYVNAQLPWHNVVLDSQGKLLAWYHPEKNQGYDHTLRLAWDFLRAQSPKRFGHKTKNLSHVGNVCRRYPSGNGLAT